MERRDRESGSPSLADLPGSLGRSELVSVAEAAKRLERSTEQVRRYLREGRLQGRRVGGQWFIEDEALTGFRTMLREQQGFLDRVRPAQVNHSGGSSGAGEPAEAPHDPLGSIIGIGHGGGSNVADGKDAYRRAFWWRR